MARLVATMGAGGGRAVALAGADGTGKTYVLRAAAQHARTPDGVVWIEGEGRPAGDVLQGVFEALYDAHPVVATPEERRTRFAGVRAVVVVDGAAADDAERIRAELPDCTVVLATRTRPAWGADGSVVALGGLAPGDGLALLVRALGSVDELDAPAARRLVALLDGNPRRLRQAAGLMATLGLAPAALVAALEPDPDGELRTLLLRSLGPEDRVVLETLAGACDATLATERLRELTGIRDVAERLRRMAVAGLVQPGSPRYRLAGALAGWELPGSAERVADRLVAFALEHRHAPGTVATELPAALALLGRASERPRDEERIALGRAFAPAAFHERRWESWGRLVRAVERAARRSGDHAALAWALHHLGTRAYALGDGDAAVAPLREALASRERLGDDQGAAATRHNLEFIFGPSEPPGGREDGDPPPGRRGGRGPRAAALAAILALVAAGGAALAGRIGAGGEEVRQDTTRPQITVRSPERGARYPAGTRVVARFACRDAHLDRCSATVGGTSVRDGDRLPGETGVHVLRVAARDRAGNRRVRRVAYGVGVSGAEVAIAAPAAGTYAPGAVPPAVFSCSGAPGLGCRAVVRSAAGATQTRVASGGALPDAPGSYTLTVDALREGLVIASDRRSYTVDDATVVLTVAIAKRSDGTRVVGNGIACPGDCETAVPPGSTVTLDAQALDPSADSWAAAAAGWDDPCPVAASRCTMSVQRDVTVAVGWIEAADPGPTPTLTPTDTADPVLR